MKKLFVLFLFLILFGIVGCQSSDNVNELPNTNDSNENEITDDKPTDQDETDKDESNNPNDNVDDSKEEGTDETPSTDNPDDSDNNSGVTDGGAFPDDGEDWVEIPSL